MMDSKRNQVFTWGATKIITQLKHSNEIELLKSHEISASVVQAQGKWNDP